MLIAMTTSETAKYVSNLDPSKKKIVKLIDPSDATKGEDVSFEIGAGATEFRLAPLDVFLMGWIYDNASSLSGKQGSDEVGIHTRVNQTNIDTVRLGLKGFSNFANAKGDQITFKTQKAVINGREYQVVHDEIMNMLGVQLVQELAGEVKRMSEVTPKEEKNSEKVSPPSA